MIKKKLTNIQRKAASLLCLGFKVKKVAKILNLHTRTIYRWKNSHNRFIKYMNKLDKEFFTYIDHKQKALMDKLFKRIEKMLDSHNTREAIFAADALLKVNRRYPDTSRVQVAHSGIVQQEHIGEVSIDHLSHKKKAHIKELLELTREASSNN